MNKARALVIDAGTLVTPRNSISPGRLVIDGGKIAEVGSMDQIAAPQSAQRVDAADYLVCPGFIEPHIHGSGGVDVMQGTREALNVVSRNAARHGTTSFLPTTVSASRDILSAAVERIGASLHHPFDGAVPIGIHLEGPFIHPGRRGTHKTTHIAEPDAELFRKWITASQSSIRLITIAPELSGAAAIVQAAAAAGIRVAMGHSNATFDEATNAVQQGVCYAVHTFNAMREFTHREPGIIGAVLSNDRIFAEIIADGVHVHPSVVRFFARAKKADKILLVTDSISATDMPDGDYSLGDDTVTVNRGVCRDAEGRLAGSTLTQDRALKNFVEWTGFSVGDALQALTENPAHALGLRAKGVLEPGADADVVILDKTFSVMKTFVAGKLVFER